MSARVHTLSKSDFKLARTCATKLYYREHKYPSALDDDEYMQLLAEGGYMVEQLAKQLFPGGITLDYGKDPQADAKATTERLSATDTVTLFEATLLDGLRMARVDILRRSPSGFDLYEVKSSSFDPEDAEKRIAKTGSPFRNMTKGFEIAGKWVEYLEDVTYQVAILKDLFPGVPVRPHLVLVDKGKVAAHEGMPGWFSIKRRDGKLASAEFIGPSELARRDPLTIGLDVSAEVAELEPVVRAETARFVASLVPEPQRIVEPLGGKCKACEFRVDHAKELNGFLECWGERGKVQPHVLDLYQGREFREELLAEGIDRVVDVTENYFTGRSGKYAARQRVQVEQTRRNEEWFDESLGRAMAQAMWPLHFIDFEAARMAIPHHKGMPPYGQLAFQWSCHTQPAPGAPLVHKEFLNLDARWPNEDFARTLREAIGDKGSVLVWSAFEKSVLNAVADDLSALGSGDKDLANWLRQVGLKAGTENSRQIDMLSICRESFYHPGMGGSNSIKMVLDAVWKAHAEVRASYKAHSGSEGNPLLGPYAALPSTLIDGEEEGVREGTGAMRAYFRMAYGEEKDDKQAVASWRQLLLDYCRLDTLAMVLIWEHWQRITRR